MAASKRNSPAGGRSAPARRGPARIRPQKAISAEAPAPVAPKAAALPEGAAAPSRSRLWIVPVLMLAVLAGVGAFLVWDARYLASLKFDMLRTARIIPQGHDRGEGTGLANLSGDPQGRMYMLESEQGYPPRLQRFDEQNSPDTLVYKADKPGRDLTKAVDVDCAPSGQVYVLLKDGRVQVLDGDLKYRGTIVTGIADAAAAAVNSHGRLFVADQPENKVVYFDNGVRAGEFGVPGRDPVPLVSPLLLRVAKDDEVVVVEDTSTGLRARVFTPDLKLRKTFLVDKITYYPPVRMGINSQLKVFFNDPGGSLGIVCWDLKTGHYVGSAQATKDGVQFVNPGCIGADRYTPDVYVHTVPGLIKCVLPPPSEGNQG